MGKSFRSLDSKEKSQRRQGRFLGLFENVLEKSKERITLRPLNLFLEKKTNCFTSNIKNGSFIILKSYQRI